MTTLCVQPGVLRHFVHRAVPHSTCPAAYCIAHLEHLFISGSCKLVCDIVLKAGNRAEYKSPDEKFPEHKSPEYKSPEYKSPDEKSPEHKSPGAPVPFVPLRLECNAPPRATCA